jgi:hypothetical protein
MRCRLAAAAIVTTGILVMTSPVPSAASTAPSDASAKKTAAQWYGLRMRGKVDAEYQQLWMGDQNAVSIDDWRQCEEPVSGVIFDVWYLAHNAGTADGVKVSRVQSVTLNPSSTSGTIQGLGLDITATKHGRVVSHPPGEQLLLTKDTSQGDSGKQWKVVIKDVGNPCDAVQSRTPSS